MIIAYIFLSEGMKGTMKIVISALLLILALHFLLESISYRKYIDLAPDTEDFEVKDDDNEEVNEDIKVDQKDTEPKESTEGFCSRYKDTKYSKKKELVDYINCQAPSVVGANSYPYTENDANFGSDVMNLNRFYRKNLDDSPSDNEIAEKNRDQLFQSLLPPRPDTSSKTLDSTPQERGVGYSLQPNTWRYKDELPMNGGEILPGITGYDDLSDQFSVFNNSASINGCEPPTRGADVNDDLRMGLGLLNSGRRGRT